MGEEIDELLQPHVLAGGGEEDRDQVSLAQGLAERLMQFLDGDRAVGQVFLHQCFIHLHHLVHDAGVELGHVAHVARARGVLKAVDHLLAAIGGQVDGAAFAAEGFLHRAEQVEQVAAVIDLVDDDHAGQISLGGELHQPPRHRVDAANRVEHDDHRLHRGHGAEGLADEVGSPGRVNEVDVRPGVVEVDQGAVDAVMEFLLQRVVVGDRVAVLHAPHPSDQSGVVQQVLDEGRLARRRTAGQGNVADVLGGVGGCHHGTVLLHAAPTPRKRVQKAPKRRGPGL